MVERNGFRWQGCRDGLGLIAERWQIVYGYLVVLVSDEGVGERRYALDLNFLPFLGVQFSKCVIAYLRYPFHSNVLKDCYS